MTLSSLLMASCNNEIEQLSDLQNQNKQIRFSTYSNFTKGAPVIDNESLKTNVGEFLVKGFIEPKTTAPDNPSAYLSAQIEYTNIWDYKNNSEIAYWPNDNLSFMAIANRDNTTGITYPKYCAMIIQIGRAHV